MLSYSLESGLDLADCGGVWALDIMDFFLAVLVDRNCGVRLAGRQGQGIRTAIDKTAGLVCTDPGLIRQAFKISINLFLTAVLEDFGQDSDCIVV